LIEIVQGGCNVLDLCDGLHGLCFLNGPVVGGNGDAGKCADNGYNDQKLKEGESLGLCPSVFEVTAV
jgi:hypothetical protein